MKRFSSISVVFSLLGGIVLLFAVAPLLRLVLAPGLDGIFDAAKDPAVSQSIFFTLSVAMLTTLAASIFVIPFAWRMARSNSKLKPIINTLIDLPVMIPHSAAGIAILGLVNRDSILGKMADSVGISFIDRPMGVAVAMAFVSLPFLYHAARDTFETIGDDYEKVALNLGSGRWETFFTISLPMAARGILSGFVLMFGRAMSEFGAVVIVAYHPMITPVMIFDRFSAYGLHAAQSVAALFVVISIIVFLALRFMAKKSQHARN